ncbi:hypothetical protein [Miniphocaeibacter halophilus]|uniref:Uncharacterized protein n=1 Tax=Miniphocaeibacter halophilus TaxID=2931922 RepID=A0AC61NGT3_9FIRM|nr:hypothetical protein [Miniphocaeibacter halophilus]QQK09023.1 hypothetical protein JFY71_05660 [Miniphocaeibacter halophilus]
MHIKSDIEEKIIDLIKSDRKIYTSTEKRLIQNKNNSKIYILLDAFFDLLFDEINAPIHIYEIIMQLINKENMIEYIRFKHISKKINYVGIKHSTSYYNLLKNIIKDKHLIKLLNSNLSSIQDNFDNERNKLADYINNMRDEYSFNKEIIQYLKKELSTNTS